MGFEYVLGRVVSSMWRSFGASLGLLMVLKVRTEVLFSVCLGRGEGLCRIYKSCLIRRPCGATGCSAPLSLHRTLHELGFRMLQQNRQGMQKHGSGRYALAYHNILGKSAWSFLFSGRGDRPNEPKKHAILLNAVRTTLCKASWPLTTWN